MFKKKSLHIFVSAVISSTTAYAATLSEPTELVVGFKPEFKNVTGAGSISGDMKAGSTLKVDPTKLGYEDRDGDEADYAKTIYTWKIDGVTLGEQADFKLPLDSVGKKVTLAVIPVSQTGDPLEGKTLLLTDLKGAGAGGGDENGNIVPDGDAKPYVGDLNIAGELKVGKQLTATYQFNANGGVLTDRSTYAWDIKGQSAAKVGGSSSVTQSGVVPPYEVTLDHVGEVIEVSVQAKNGMGTIGNTLTVGTDGTVDKNGSEQPGGGDNSGGNGDLETGGENGGVVPFVPSDPISVTINYNSTATLEDNGIAGSRPVAGVDEMMITFTPAKGASPETADYMFRWFADGVKVKEGVGTMTYTPTGNEQGKSITASVEPK